MAKSGSIEWPFPTNKRMRQLKLFQVFAAAAIFTGTAPFGYAAPVESDGDVAQMRRLETARQFIDAGKPGKAVQLEIDPVINYYEEKYSKSLVKYIAPALPWRASRTFWKQHRSRTRRSLLARNGLGHIF